MGAILAGGQARRFGSDKAHALYLGKRMIDHVHDALSAQTREVVVCGRGQAEPASIPDLPEAGLGPLGGLNAALDYAGKAGFSHVLCAGVDAPNVPRDLATQLSGQGAAIAETQPVIGLWPVQLADDLGAFLNEGGRALYGFADRVKARRVAIHPPPLNINRPQDLPPSSPYSEDFRP